MERGKWNAITDVPGVKVGHVTLEEQREEEYLCTGVTALLPHGGNVFEQKVRAASFVLNGFGKTAGLIQLEELGLLESPIMLTNTFSVAAVLEGTLRHMLEENPAIGDTTSTLNVVVGECNDSYLNSIRLLAVQPTHAIEAIKSAAEDPLSQGAVGAGKGMICYGAKGGIGSSSRLIPAEDRSYTVGVLTLTNFGKPEECRINEWLARNGLSSQEKVPTLDEPAARPDGSVIIVVATDAPVNERQLKRFAKRAAIGLGRTGTNVHNGSGDIIIAFSNAHPVSHTSNSMMAPPVAFLRDDHPIMNTLFEAVIDSTEEAVYQSLLHAETTEGRSGRTVQRWPFIEDGE
ncbi:P1 family peptidase [Sporosarcina sp. Te-1]|uniref:P1 family peptidase n=1 Tax=Sporosarcina sp. Te-1 TaxID=2818390 RepID=UPI001A9FFD9A|nr:P1 family peptidase [Sporosarcina sp. Te-1]QTD39615.1 P1 family peptidase [Sporosarcina sp. Te-1]